MTKLEKYTIEIIKRISEFNNCTEDEIIRFIYLTLGKKIVFDLNWVYGNDFTRAGIYYNEDTPDSIDEYISEEKWSLICKSIAYVLKYIGQKIGINIETVQEEPKRFNPYPHVYNKITKKDGTEYNIDLYADLPNIYMNRRTEYFGFIDYAAPRKFKREELEVMDYKFGYITDKKPYTDDYYYLLKDYISRMESMYEKVKVILENPSPYIEFNLDYDERRRYIINTINSVLQNEHSNDWKWEYLDCYYYKDKSMVPKEIIYLKEEDSMHFFEYNLENNNFNQISGKELADLISNGLRFPDRCSSQEYLWISKLGSLNK